MGCFRASIVSEEAEKRGDGDESRRGGGGAGGSRRGRNRHLGSSASSASSPPLLPGNGLGCDGEELVARREGGGGGAAAAACRRMVLGMKTLNLIFSGASRSLSLSVRKIGRTGSTKEEEKGRGGRAVCCDSENNKSWLLADAQTEQEEGDESTTSGAAAAADPHSMHSSFRFSFGSQAEVEPTVLLVSEDEHQAEASSSSSHDHMLLIKWRRLESLERSISPVAAGLIRLSYPEIRSATRDFHPGRVLGRGALSRVYRGRVVVGRGRRRAAAVAVKRLQGEDRECTKAFCRELMIVSGLRHPNVASLLGFCVDPQGLFLVYKFVSGGSLDHHLHPEEEEEGGGGRRRRRRRQSSSSRWMVGGGGGLSWGARWKVGMGIARAVEYLHHGTDRCIVHRDIKPSNILLSSNKTPKLCDFGLATWTHGISLPFLCKTVKGTFGYLAPEYFQHGKLSDKTDVYAFGVVLLELITGRKPIDTNRPQGDENLVLWAKPLLQQEVVIEELVDPKLKFSTYNRGEMSRMVRAAAACLNNEESGRPRIGQVIGILSGEEENCNDWSVFTGNGCFAGYSPQLQDTQEKSDMRGHLALAMLGVSDNEEDDMYGR